MRTEEVCAEHATRLPILQVPLVCEWRVVFWRKVPNIMFRNPTEQSKILLLSCTSLVSSVSCHGLPPFPLFWCLFRSLLVRVLHAHDLVGDSVEDMLVLLTSDAFQPPEPSHQDGSQGAAAAPPFSDGV